MVSTLEINDRTLYREDSFKSKIWGKENLGSGKIPTIKKCCFCPFLVRIERITKTFDQSY